MIDFPLRLATDVEWPAIMHVLSGIDPEDNDALGVRTDCDAGRALCFVSDDGVLVVSVIPNKLANGLVLFVRFAVSWGQAGAIQRNDPHLDVLAREFGASVVQFRTQRPGMQKILGPEWSLSYTEFARPVHGIEI